MSTIQQTRRNAPCPCGSGKRYKHCCGWPITDRPLPQGDVPVPPFLGLPDRVIVIPGFLAPAECEGLIDLSRKLRRVDAEVKLQDESGGSLVSAISDVRITTTVKTFEEPDRFLPLVARALRESVGPAFGADIEWFEWPDVLFYGPGGRYDLHNDADILDRRTRRWQRALDRDISLLIYLNDDFTGGALEFPERGETIRPEAGMLVAFPSDHRFAHAALPVETGSRYVIVSWAAVSGSPRLLNEPQLHVVYSNRQSLPQRLVVREVEGAGFFIEPPGRTV